jgi:hypothetical protein
MCFCFPFNLTELVYEMTPEIILKWKAPQSHHPGHLLSKRAPIISYLGKEMLIQPSRLPLFSTNVITGTTVHSSNWRSSNFEAPMV